jgi:uncharacterized protein YbdZ (MbtH family)
MKINAQWLPLMAAILTITTSVSLWVVFGSNQEQTVPEEETFVIEAFQKGGWDIPDGWRLFADEEEIGRNPSLLEYHENNWTSFPGELRNETGPWTYACTLWYNTETEETYIQKICAGDNV